MSQSELQRFLDDLRRDSELAEEFHSRADDLDAQVRWANDQGYLFSRDEAAAVAGFGELSDEDLEQAAGGWTGDPPPPTS